MMLLLPNLIVGKLQRTAAAIATEAYAISTKDEKQRELEVALEQMKAMDSVAAVKDDMIRQLQSQNHLFEVSQNALIQKMAQIHRELEEALERIKVLQSRCTENEEMLRQKDTAHNALIQKMAETSRTQAPCHAPSSPRLNAFDDFNSDLKLQAEAGRALAVALRQQIGDEQERAAALQKQLVREREQVRPSCFALASLYVYIYVFD